MRLSCIIAFHSLNRMTRLALSPVRRTSLSFSSYHGLLPLIPSNLRIQPKTQHFSYPSTDLAGFLTSAALSPFMPFPVCCSLPSSVNGSISSLQDSRRVHRLCPSPTLGILGGENCEICLAFHLPRTTWSWAAGVWWPLESLIACPFTGKR